MVPGSVEALEKPDKSSGLKRHEKSFEGAVWIALNFAASAFSHFFSFFFFLPVLQNRGTNNTVAAL